MLDKKTILITGCSSGIGLRVAELLNKRGYQVFASARKIEDVTRLKQQGFESLQLDLSDSDSIKSAVSQVLEMTGGQLYALFNNGAYGLPGAVEDLTRDALRDQFEVNVFGTMELTNLIVPVMRKQGEGRIIQNSSVLGIVAFPFRGAYTASKYALEGMTDTLRLELNGSGISVSLIEPGPIESRFRANAFMMYEKYIDKSNSFFKASYEAMEARLKKEGPAAPFTLPADAVYEKVLHALESKRPKIRYSVTVPTKLFAILRRFLPYHVMDRILISASGSGER